MSMPNPYLQYQQNAVKSVGPGELTSMLYDGLVKYIRLSIMSIENKDLKACHNYLLRAQEILAHLNETLDFQYEISKNLSTLYDYMIRRLMQANVKKDSDIAAEVLGLAGELRETWRQALKLAKENDR
ncbi:MAG: flagellar export chaperone FliS [Bacillota bacterium]